MHSIYRTLVALLVVSLLALPAFGQEVEPNNTIATANALGLGEMIDADLSQTCAII